MWKTMVRANWHLLLLMALVVGAAVVFALRPSKAADAQALTAEGEIGIETNAGEDGPVNSEASRWGQPTKDARFQAGIEKYEHEVQYNPKSADAKANLFKLANLYFSTGDYKNAAKYYVSLKAEFPKYEGMRYVFQNLSICYTKLNNPELRRNTLREMMEYFPADAPEHKFAEQELGL